MADSKKYNGSTWEHSLRKLTTSTDTITTLPADVYADGNNATVGLVGNMEQSGTPSPTTPIQPQECGEMTGNLFDYKTAYTSYLQPDGTISGTAQQLLPIRNLLANFVGQTVTISIYCSNVSATQIQLMARENGVVIYSNNITRGNSGYLTLSVTPEISTDYWAITYGTSGGNETLSQFMLNTGSQPLPYEPYGYKIPISSANTTTPVYLGEVESTRQIKQLVLTGEEEWIISTGWKKTATSVFYMALADIIHTSAENAVFIYSNAFSAATHNELHYGDSDMVARTGTEALTIRISDSIATTTADFKTYLAAQYAAGTPVCVWYVLATPQTAVANEPLRKIGDYADTVSGITIPTIAGADNFDVLTTLKPSEVSLSYTGWHDATVKEWDGSQWNE